MTDKRSHLSNQRPAPFVVTQAPETLILNWLSPEKCEAVLHVKVLASFIYLNTEIKTLLKANSNTPSLNWKTCANLNKNIGALEITYLKCL